MTWANYGTYLVFVVLLVLAPGPDTAVILKNSLVGGRRGGVSTAAGIAVGNLIQGTAAALGVGALITRSQPVFDALRIIGAVYLCWLGIQAFRSARRASGTFGLDTADGDPGVDLSGRAFRWWRQGFLSNVTNPKVMALYLSVLPQFLQDGHASTQAALVLAYTVGVLGLAWQLVIVAMIDRARRWIRRPRVRAALDAITGTALVGFGIGLAAESL
ncbi:LysE family translocator [Nocardia sp. NPDC052566]|uniref:LysE family translocator n=1 Tax=Nocardia sp. NPDC052566 TaxID=3364330 RepID=UPI0037CBCC99